MLEADTEEEVASAAKANLPTVAKSYSSFRETDTSLASMVYQVPEVLNSVPLVRVESTLPETVTILVKAVLPETL